jgi:hypothetical protein
VLPRILSRPAAWSLFHEDSLAWCSRGRCLNSARKGGYRYVIEPIGPNPPKTQVRAIARHGKARRADTVTRGNFDRRFKQRFFVVTRERPRLRWSFWDARRAGPPPRRCSNLQPKAGPFLRGRMGTGFCPATPAPQAASRKNVCRPQKPRNGPVV